MNDWVSIFTNVDISTAEKYRRIENGPIGLIAKYYFKKLNQSNCKLADFIKEIKTGKTPPTHKKEYFNSSDVDWYKPDEIGKSFFLYESSNKISKLANRLVRK